jgi:hypothetical protein
MKTFTTKAATNLLYADYARSNGCPDVWVLQNASGSAELEATTAEIEEFQANTSTSVESDLITDDVMDSLIEFLNLNRKLDQSRLCPERLPRSPDRREDTPRGPETIPRRGHDTLQPCLLRLQDGSTR